MEERKKIKLELSTADKALEIFAWITILAIWILTFIFFSNLPDTIPIHFNGTGQVDGYGSKANILTLPIVATIIFIGLTVLNKFPHIFNYPVAVRDDNAKMLYTYATRLLRFLKLSIVVIFGFIEFKTIQNAQGEADGIGVWFLPFAMLLVFIPLIYFIVKSFKIKQKNNR